MLLFTLVHYYTIPKMLSIVHKNLETNHKKWLELRNNSINDNGEKLCYCGRKSTCPCADPDLKTFTESINNKTITWK